jgi:hypothetical protein
MQIWTVSIELAPSTSNMQEICIDSMNGVREYSFICTAYY